MLEVYGHVSGQYPIELSSGFDLDPTFFCGWRGQAVQVIPGEVRADQRTVMAGDSVMKKLTLTIGDILMIEKNT